MIDRSQSFCASAGLEEYQKLLNRFRQEHYEFVTFPSFRGEPRQLLLRHDVDLSLSHALAMARVEAGLGINSTFFFLLSSEFYNLLSFAGRLALREVLSLGHHIGLHFEVNSEITGADLERHVELECRVLEDLSGVSIDTVAPHRPTASCPDFLGRSGLFAGRLQAYAPQFFLQAGYVSDSAGYWSHGSPLEHASFKSGTAMQLLIHPYLWVATGETQSTKILNSLEERRARLIEVARQNFRALA